ncbi:STAS domain-containing protein [Streptomyces sp. NPDC001185]
MFDLSAVTFMDSTAISVLIAANNAAGEVSGWVRLAAMS